MTYIGPVRVVMGPEETAAANAVLATGMLVQGEQVAAFESEFAALVDGRPCVAVNSGTSALHLALLALGIGPGDEVIVPSFTFAATANSVAMTGATPVFADISADTFCLDVDGVIAAVTDRTTAVMPVHLFGQAADLTALAELCRARSLALIEDACQAHSATHQGRPVGSWGDAAAFSFYATKNMTTGEGGMVVCADETVARRVRLLRNQGMEVRYQNEVAGLNNRMTDLAAAIGRVQLGKLEGFTHRRRDIADQYTHGLGHLRTPSVRAGNDHVFHQYTVRVANRDAVLAELQARGIGAMVYYPIPTHRLPAYGSDLELPETERAAAEVLSLPIHPHLTDGEVATVVATVRDVVAELHG